MKAFFLSFFLLLSLAAHAVIVDVSERAAPYQWTGVYVGLQAGYGTSSTTMSFTPSDDFPVRSGALHPDPSGWLWGVQLGIDLQAGCFVYGLIADIAGTGIKGSDAEHVILDGGTNAPEVVDVEQCIDWYGTLRPRIGFCICPRLLLYLSGGLAFGKTSYDTSLGHNGEIKLQKKSFFKGTIVENEIICNSHRSQMGWALGFGLDYAFCRKLSLVSEYLYVSLGTDSKLGKPLKSTSDISAHYDFESRAHLFKFGLNYHFCL